MIIDNYDVLRNDLINGKPKEKQWLDLEKRVREFVAGDNPQSEKDELGKYAECCTWLIIVTYFLIFNKAFQVAFRAAISPSTTHLFFFWKDFTAAWNFVPAIPSALPQLYPKLFRYF